MKALLPMLKRLVFILLALSLMSCGSGGLTDPAPSPTPAPTPSPTPTLPAPTGLTATAVSDSRIDLTWTAAAGVSGYRIYKAGQKAADVTSTSWSDTGLTANTSYCYSISSFDASNNESAVSSQICATTLATPPADPANVAAFVETTTKVVLSWTASVGAFQYYIYRDGAKIATAAPVTGTTYTDTSVTANTKYTYKVTAVGPSGSESSGDASTSGTDTGLTVPSGVTASVDSSTQITVSWIQAAGSSVKGYHIYKNGDLLGSAGSVTTTSIVDSGLEPSTMYCYRVSSTDLSGIESARSVTVCGTTDAPPAPASISLSASPTSIQSDGSTPSTITVNALSPSNVVLSGVTVKLATDTGVLFQETVVTNSATPATLVFNTGGSEKIENRTNRTATITATAGAVTAQIPIQIKGSETTLALSKTALPDDGSSQATCTVTTTDGGGNLISGAPVTLSKSGDGNVTVTPDSGITGADGTFTATITGAAAGSVILTADALGVKATQGIEVSSTAATFAIDEQRLNGTVILNETTTAMKFSDTLTIRVNAAPSTTQVTFATTTGVWDGGTSSVKTVAVSGGKASANLTTAQAGIANVMVYDQANPVTSDTLKVAMTSGAAASKITLQASPTVVPRSVGTTTGSSTLLATVRDASGNPIGNAPVSFSIVNPTGGGEAVSPVVVLTAATTSSDLSLGQAKTTFTSGSLVSPAAGVQIRGTVVGTTVETEPVGVNVTDSGNDVAITIGGLAGSISIGRATTITELDPATYSLPMSILVSDSNGNAVPYTTVTLGAWPIAWSTGKQCTYDPDDGISKGTFWDEDVNENLFLDAGEDGARNYYSSGVPATVAGTIDTRITPVNSDAGNVPSTVTTDANGVATFNLNYRKQSAIWTLARIRATAVVSGSETRSQIVLRLPVLLEDADPCLLGDSPYMF